MVPTLRRQQHLFWGMALLAFGMLWLLHEARFLRGFRFATLAGATALALGASRFYLRYRSEPARRYGWLVPAGFLAGIAVHLCGTAFYLWRDTTAPLWIFGGLAAAFARIHALDPSRGWALVSSWFSAVIGVASFVGGRHILGGELSAAVFLWGTGAVFIWHFLRSGKDWALLTGGILLTLGFLPPSTRFPWLDRYTPGLSLLGLGASFALVFLLGRPGSSQWARWPALVLGLLGVFVLFVGVARPVLTYGLPVALIATGAALVRNALRPNGAAAG